MAERPVNVGEGCGELPHRGSSIVIRDRLQRGHRTISESADVIGDRWTRTFQRLGGLSAGKAVLDIGCGPGRMSIAIGDRPFRLVQ